ncbi:hypothetical protein V7021_02640 [Cytobacillus firmus]
MVLLAEVGREVAVRTLGCGFLLFVSEAGLGSDTGAPIFSFCVRS